MLRYTILYTLLYIYIYAIVMLYYDYEINNSSRACKSCHIHVGISTFCCDCGKHRNDRRYNLGRNLLLGGETHVTPSIVPFSNK